MKGWKEGEEEEGRIQGETGHQNKMSSGDGVSSIKESI